MNKKRQDHCLPWTEAVVKESSKKSWHRLKRHKTFSLLQECHNFVEGEVPSLSRNSRWRIDDRSSRAHVIQDVLVSCMPLSFFSCFSRNITCKTMHVVADDMKKQGRREEKASEWTWWTKRRKRMNHEVNSHFTPGEECDLPAKTEILTHLLEMLL